MGKVPEKYYLLAIGDFLSVFQNLLNLHLTNLLKPKPNKAFYTFEIYVKKKVCGGILQSGTDN